MIIEHRKPKFLRAKSQRKPSFYANFFRKKVTVLSEGNKLKIVAKR